MEAVRSENFVRWAAGVGIGFDPRYPESRCLSLLPPRQQARFWVLPSYPATWAHFVASLLDALDCIAENNAGFGLHPGSGSQRLSRSR
jgi:hypothetical protein